MSNRPPDAWERCIEVLRPALVLAPRSYLGELRERLADAGVIAAVASRDTPVIFDWIVRLLARQGISNHAAEVFLERNGSPTFLDIADHMSKDARCSRLRCHWSFESCGYRRLTSSCRTPHQQVGCPVTVIPARKGALAEAAIGLWLFVRDCCSNGDFVGWIDDRLAAADPGADASGRGVTMQKALLEPLTSIVGTGPKVWSMILAELLLGADPLRERWVTAGASFVAVDSLVHAFLHRTGCLQRLDAAHRYGPACYEPGGCTDVIASLAARIDAREFDPGAPAVFPRWVQSAIWSFCAADGWSVCNGTKIDDAVGCEQQSCPAFRHCSRLPLLS